MSSHIRHFCVFGIISVSLVFIGCPADFTRDNPNERDFRGYPSVLQ